MQGSVKMLQTLSKPLRVTVTLKLPVSGFLQNSKLPMPKLHCYNTFSSKFLSRLVSTHLDRQGCSCSPRHPLPTASHTSICWNYKSVPIGVKSISHKFNKKWFVFMMGNHYCLQQTYTSPAEFELSSEATDSFDTCPSAVPHAVSTANDPKPEPGFTRLHAHVQCTMTACLMTTSGPPARPSHLRLPWLLKPFAAGVQGRLPAGEALHCQSGGACCGHCPRIGNHQGSPALTYQSLLMRQVRLRQGCTY